MWLSLSFVKELLCFLHFFFFIPPSDYVTEEKSITCFHEYVMKKYEVLAPCYSK